MKKGILSFLNKINHDHLVHFCHKKTIPFSMVQYQIHIFMMCPILPSDNGFLVLLTSSQSSAIMALIALRTKWEPKITKKSMYIKVLTSNIHVHTCVYEVPEWYFVIVSPLQKWMNEWLLFIAKWAIFQLNSWWEQVTFSITAQHIKRSQ